MEELPCKKCLTLAICKGISNEEKIDGFVNKIVPKCSTIRKFLYINKYRMGSFYYNGSGVNITNRFNTIQNFFNLEFTSRR